MYLFQLSKENLNLARSEVEELLELKQKPILLNSFLITDTITKKNLQKIPRLAYTKKFFRLLFDCKPKELAKKIENYNWNKVYKKDFALSIHGTKNYSSKQLADIVWQKLKKPKTNLKNPTTKIEMLFVSNKVFCCLSLWENKEQFSRRRSHLRPQPHPSSLSPKLARAMVNMANSKKITDPFCGAGGILLEAGLMNLKTRGSDIDRVMLNRARINLDHYNIKHYRLDQKDALTLKKAESIVTDLPYGKNTKAKNVKELLLNFLENTQARTMVIGIPESINTQIVKNTHWKIKRQFSVYLHKSLSKKIILLC